MTARVGTPAVRLAVHLGPDDLTAALRRDVLTGLLGQPKELPPKWLYDERGCELFDEITRLREYYPTRRERSILEVFAGQIAATTKADTLIELGSGTSDKTRLLLDALARTGTLRRFAPFDVAESTLRAASVGILSEYPGIEIDGVVGDFERHLSHLPTGGRRLVAFLGGTIGNLEPPARARLLGDLAAALEPGDTFLLGTDLLKSRARLIAAYDDTAGVTAAFNRNLLEVLNRRLGAHFDPNGFEHVARFDEHNSWIEMRLRSPDPQRVTIDELGIEVGFDAGEDLRTEISTKFTRHGVRCELEAAGFEPLGWYTDPAGDFALTLARR
ncbi:MAG: L-histidine N(alpha)-methyltransferase [Acidimicrobiales bacterium]